MKKKKTKYLILLLCSLIKCKRVPSIFSDESTGSFICLRQHIYMSHTNFMRIGCTLLTCDMYMFRLKTYKCPGTFNTEDGSYTFTFFP
jgi:hypothetical protein